MKLSHVLAIATLSLLTTAAFAQRGGGGGFGPPLGSVTINNLQYGGSGCPAFTVAKNVSPDGQAFTLLYDEFIAEVGPGVPFRESRKNCSILLELDYPPGWSFTLTTIDTRGYASLERGVKLNYKTRFHHQGERLTGEFAQTINGDFDDDYQVTDTIPVVNNSWSPCGEKRALVVNTSLQLKTRRRGRTSKFGLATVDSTDGYTAQIYGLAWQPCPGF